MKNKEFVKGIAAILVAALMVVGTGIVLAADNGNGIRASKATAMVSELTLLDWEPEAPAEEYDPEDDTTIGPYEGEWTPILTQNIKTPNQKDLFIDVSLETGLWTRTKVKSKVSADYQWGEWDTSRAQAQVLVRVGVDGNYAEAATGVQEPGVAFPREVTFNEREQFLSAKFMGIFTGACFDVDPDTGVVTILYDCIVPEELDLILRTLSANSFNFLVADLTPGNHVITVEAKIITNGEANEGSYQAMALVGQGSVFIECVRMIKGEDYLDVPET